MVSWISVALLVVWCALTVQTVVNLLAFPDLEPARNTPDSRVSIVIPARNEERNIGTTLDAALGQEYPSFEVIVVDDASEDGTAREIAKRAFDRRLSTLSARPLGPGWLGKPNALATGAASATGEWLLFMDADVELTPGALTAAVSACERHGWDQLALIPHFERQGFWEEVLMPIVPVAALVYLPSFLALFSKTRLATGAGAFALVRRRAYEAIGGHEAIRGSVVDDIRLAMELKRAGYRCRGRGGSHLVRLRMYHGLREILDGFTKNAHAAFGDSLLRPLLFVPGSLFVGLAPFLWFFLRPSPALGASLSLLLTARTLVQLRLRFPLWPVLLSPVTTVAALVIVLRSLRMARVDGVVRWRGREYKREMTEF